MRKSKHLDPGKIAVMLVSGSAAHPSNCTRLWCSKHPQSTRKIFRGKLECVALVYCLLRRRGRDGQDVGLCKASSWCRPCPHRRGRAIVWPSHQPLGRPRLDTVSGQGGESLQATKRPRLRMVRTESHWSDEEMRWATSRLMSQDKTRQQLRSESRQLSSQSITTKKCPSLEVVNISQSETALRSAVLAQSGTDAMVPSAPWPVPGHQRLDSRQSPLGASQHARKNTLHIYIYIYSQYHKNTSKNHPTSMTWAHRRSAPP